MILADAADANFATHATWALRTLAGATVIDTPELVVADSGLLCDTFNIICRARLTDLNAQRRVASTIKRFRQSGRPFSWWSGPADRPGNLVALLSEAGLVHAETELTMSADLARVTAGVVPPDGLEVRRAADAAQLTDFARVISEGASAASDIIQFYVDASSALLALNSPQRFYVGYLSGEPVASAELTVTGEVAGVYGVATRERFRKRGFGTAMTRHALIEAGTSGRRTAVLQATAAGAGIYTNLGFAAYGEVREFKP
ncbi:MAG: GNAT family N-acetyltransferase [Gemmatimonadetes bacterium]|nr:GNAT family N-acetyltransferase [Gemmatimonadota bacterium]